MDRLRLRLHVKRKEKMLRVEAEYVRVRGHEIKFLLFKVEHILA